MFDNTAGGGTISISPTTRTIVVMVLETERMAWVLMLARRRRGSGMDLRGGCRVGRLESCFLLICRYLNTRLPDCAGMD